MSDTPETDEHEHFVASFSPKYCDPEFCRTLERQRDTARAAAKEAENAAHGGQELVDQLRAEVERLTKERDDAMDSGIYATDPQLRTEIVQRRKAMADIVRELGHGCCGLGHEEIAPEVKKVMAELATLRATRDADHGAAIEAAAIKLGTQLYGACRGFHETEAIRVAMRALVATVTNSQQKGGEEPCATPTLSEASKHCASSAAPTSDPEGAATPAADAKRLADRIVKHVENGIVYEVGASQVAIVRDVFEKWIREAIEHHAIQQATWHCETLSKLEAATPSPTLEKLAKEIDDLYEAPSRIRPLRRILERKFGASHSVAEAAKEIGSILHGHSLSGSELLDIESILSRLLGNTESERRKLMGQLHEIDVSIEGYVDGAPDCSALSSLCNRIQTIIHPPQ